jgi:hypothetical protein
MLLHAIVHPADIQDRDGGMRVVSTLFGMYPFLKKLVVDGSARSPWGPFRRLGVRHARELCLMAPLACFAQPLPAIGQGLCQLRPQCLGRGASG